MAIAPISRVVRSFAKPAAVMLAALPLWTMAQVGPSISGPSVVRPSQAAEFSGRGFTASGALSISVTAPGGAEAVFGTVAAADGTLTYRLTASALGMHTLKVLDASGAVLAKVSFLAME